MKPGQLVWITGLAGAGKSTLANALSKRLWQDQYPHALLDGDIFRATIGDQLGYSREDRLQNAHRLARMAHLLANQGLTVVCATVSLFHEIHRLNRATVKDYIEVLVQCSREELQRRDQKGLYSSAKGQVVGIDQPGELPTSPDLVLDNSQSSELSANITRLYHAMRETAHAPTH